MTNREFLPNINIESGDDWFEIFSSNLKRQYGDRAFEHFSRELLNSRGIEPNFIGNLNNRPKLNSESGIIVSNHPRGAVDAAIILAALQEPSGRIKKDLKMLVLETVYPTYTKYFGEEKFFPAKKNPFEAPKIFNEMAKHINTGGSILIFPENFKAGITSGVMDFGNGLSYLMSKLDPERMCYTFAINPADVNKKAEDQKPGQKNMVRVDERYSTCSEWQSVMAGVPEGARTQQSELLKNHFFELHKENL